jgi:Fe-S-cluster containining protein
MNKSELLHMVKKLNLLFKEAIIGPNCIDPNICDGSCCSINMDIPQDLAEYYISEKLATWDDFQEGRIYKWEIKKKLRKNEPVYRCHFFDINLNGCSIHDSGMKPPLCWVYPTGIELKNIRTSCKRAEGWNVKNPENLLKAKILLKKYADLCLKEKNEIEN